MDERERPNVEYADGEAVIRGVRICLDFRPDVSFTSYCVAISKLCKKEEDIDARVKFGGEEYDCKSIIGNKKKLGTMILFGMAEAEPGLAEILVRGEKEKAEKMALFLYDTLTDINPPIVELAREIPYSRINPKNQP